MEWMIWGVLLPACMVASWRVAHKPLRRVAEEVEADRARLRFRRDREWLEARFLTALGKLGPIERLRWEGAHWHDRVHWARDNRTRRLLALVEVHFDPDPLDGSPEPPADHATALFEYRKGTWAADGKRLDATRPDEALSRQGRFEPVEPPPRGA